MLFGMDGHHVGWLFALFYFPSVLKYFAQVSILIHFPLRKYDLQQTSWITYMYLEL